MKMYHLIPAALIALGMLGLVYSGFSYTRETYEILSGRLDWSEDNEFLNGRVWASIAALVIGCVLLSRGKNAV